MMMSAVIAWSVRAVLYSDSPFSTLLPDPDTLITSALSIFDACSKDTLVRVLGSVNSVITVLPRSVGTFLISRFITSRIASAFWKTSSISDGEKSSRSRTCLRPGLMSGPVARTPCRVPGTAEAPLIVSGRLSVRLV